MSKKLTSSAARLVLVASGLSVASCGVPGDEASTNTDTVVQRSGLTSQDIGFHWAPIHYQSVDLSGGNHGRQGLGDYILPVNYDGEFTAINNWDNLDTLTISSPPPAAAYYHVDETSTHWIASYVFYHPRDWDDGLDEQEHENDMEGAVEFIRKDGSPFGVFEGMATVYHNEWKLYRSSSASYLTTGPAGPNPIILLRTEVAVGETEQRPVTMQQSQGHGLVACTQVGCGVTTGVRYRPNLQTGDGTAASAGMIKDGRYRLIEQSSPDGLWAHRFDHNTFASWSNFSGNDTDSCGAGATWGCPQNAAGTPWATSGTNDVFFLFTDPAKMIYEHYAGWDNTEATGPRAFSLDYEGRNPLGTPQSFNHQWVPAGADLQSARPVAAAQGASALHLFATLPGSSPQAVKYSLYDGANWQASSSLPSGVTTDQSPAAVTCNQRMYVFVKTGAGEQIVKWTWKDVSSSDTSAWASWDVLPSATTNAPVALTCRDGKVYLFLKGGMDNHVYFTTLATWTNSWGVWREVPINGVTTKPLTAAVNMNNLELDLFAVGTDNNLYVNRLCYGCDDTQWTGWVAHPGFLSVRGATAAWDPVTSPATGVQVYFSNAGFQRVHEDAFDGTSWRGSAMVRGYQYSSDAPLGVPYGYNVLLFAAGSSDAVNQRIWMTTGQPPGRLLSDLSKQPFASQISDYAPAARALDRRTDSSFNSLYDGHINGAWSSGYVSHTNQANNPWWQVDLRTTRTITQVDVFNRTDACCMNRLRNWSIRISNDGVNWTEVFRDDRPEGAGQLTTLNGNGPMFVASSLGRTQPGGSWSARFVRVQINRPNEWLHLAEVQVWGF